jgi:hypothetical protein
LDERQKVGDAEKTLKKIVDRYCDFAKNQRTIEAQRKKYWDRLILPKLGHRQIDDIKRSEIVALIEDIAAQSGGPPAEKAFIHISTVFNRHAIPRGTAPTGSAFGWRSILTCGVLPASIYPET